MVKRHKTLHIFSFGDKTPNLGCVTLQFMTIEYHYFLRGKKKNNENIKGSAIMCFFILSM